MKLITFNFKDFCLRSGCEPERVVEIKEKLSVKGSWLGGGAIRRTLIKQALDSDFDFFFTNVDTKDSFVGKAKALGFVVTRETKHHTQLEGTLGDSKLPIIVQAIHFRYYDKPEEIIDSFDYTITQFVLSGDDLITTAESLWDLGRKRLAVHKITYPVATMRRMLKYGQQGFTACGGCMADLYRKTLENPLALGELDIEYVD